MRLLKFFGTADAANVVTLFYDLRSTPLTYDFATALCLSEIKRRELQADHIHVVIVPKDNVSLRDESAAYDAVIDIDAREWRLANLVLPICSLVPQVKQLSVCQTRQQADLTFQNAKHVFPEKYMISLPSHYPLRGMHDAGNAGIAAGVLRAPNYALRHTREWLESNAGDKRVVTITLRNYGYGSARNSNLAAWETIALELEEDGFYVIVLADNDAGGQQMSAGLKQFCRYSEAEWNIGLRTALYQLSDVTMGLNSGPMNLCMYNELTRYLIYKMETPEVSETTIEMLEMRGFYRDKHVSYASDFQRIIWQDDKATIIKKAFYQLIKDIDTAHDGDVTPYRITQLRDKL